MACAAEAMVVCWMQDKAACTSNTAGLGVAVRVSKLRGLGVDSSGWKTGNAGNLHSGLAVGGAELVSRADRVSRLWAEVGDVSRLWPDAGGGQMVEVVDADVVMDTCMSTGVEAGAGAVMDEELTGADWLEGKALGDEVAGADTPDFVFIIAFGSG
ncbi:hypothetical protein BJV74DRAFT_799904 [Russula compacta]|nr:hypothetical protein BJV74DRAFT_799904 [Russula compacta]